jgi:hypothetical protein
MQKFCAVICLALAVVSQARADDAEVTLWVGLDVLYGPPIFDDEKRLNIKHGNWGAWYLSTSQAKCEAHMHSGGTPLANETRTCQPVGLTKYDFDHESHFAACSHLQSMDMALYMETGSYEPLPSICDELGQDRDWVSRGVEWYEKHPLTQSCVTWARRNGPTFAEVRGNQITKEGSAHASTSQSVAAVRAEVERRAAKYNLEPGESKLLTVEQLKRRLSREAVKKGAADGLRAMDDKALESYLDQYCADSYGNTLREAAVTLFAELQYAR